MFLLLPFLACTPSSPNNTTPFVNTALDNIEIRNGLYYRDKQPYTGCLFSLQHKGKDTAYSGHFKQGREHGVYKKWYPNGRLMEVRVYENGKKTGIHKGYWPDGRLRFRYHFSRDLYEGYQYRWHENGQLYSRKNYSKGQEAGMQQEWDKQGNLVVNYQSVHGRQYGNIGNKNCASLWQDSVYHKPAP
jgi:antitoxin component YwqK of YwqJK toxin-antitoxin module